MIIGIYNFKYLSKSLLVCLLTIGISGVVDLLAIAINQNGWYIPNFTKNNSLLYNNFIPLLNFLWWFAFHLELKSRMKKRVVSLFFIISSTTVILVSMFFFDNRKEINDIGLSIFCLNVIVLCLYYLYQLAFKSDQFSLERHRFFLIACGLLLYYSFNITIFAMLNSKPNFNFFNIWEIKQTTLIFFNLLIAYNFYSQRKLTLKWKSKQF